MLYQNVINSQPYLSRGRAGSTTRIRASSICLPQMYFFSYISSHPKNLEKNIIKSGKLDTNSKAIAAARISPDAAYALIPENLKWARRVLTLTVNLHRRQRRNRRHWASMRAERVAVFAAVAAVSGPLQALAVIADTAAGCTSGLCLEVRAGSARIAR